jgi:hypothetical protein
MAVEMTSPMGERVVRWIAATACCLLAVAASAQEAGVEPGPGDSSIGGQTVIDDLNRVTVTGELRFWRAYSADGGRAMLKVFRPEGSRLVLVGASPLETLPPGQTELFEIRIPVNRNDLIGVYCPDANCVDQLSGGQSLVAEGDRGTSQAADFASSSGTPAVHAGTTRAFDGPSRGGNRLILPVVGRGPGLAGTQWISSLELFNTSASEVDVVLFYNRSGIDNTTPAAQASLSVPARGLVVIEDLLAEAFLLDDAGGSVDIQASAPVIAHSRIANFGSGNGTYGQLVPAVPETWAMGDDTAPGLDTKVDVVSLFEVRHDGDFRTNIGATNVSGVTLQLEVRAFLDTSPIGEALVLELPPFSHRQINGILPTLGIPNGTLGVRLELAASAGSGGRFVAYASVVDNQTGDAVFQLGERQPSLP